MAPSLPTVKKSGNKKPQPRCLRPLVAVEESPAHGVRKVSKYVIVPRALRKQVKKQLLEQLSIKDFMRAKRSCALIESVKIVVDSHSPASKWQDADTTGMEANNEPLPDEPMIAMPAEAADAAGKAALPFEAQVGPIRLADLSEHTTSQAMDTSGGDEDHADPLAHQQSASPERTDEERDMPTASGLQQECSIPKQCTGEPQEVFHQSVSSQLNCFNCVSESDAVMCDMKDKGTDHMHDCNENDDAGEPDSEPETQPFRLHTALHVSQPDSEPEVDSDAEQASQVDTCSGHTGGLFKPAPASCADIEERQEYHESVARSPPSTPSHDYNGRDRCKEIQESLQAICEAPGLSEELISSVAFIGKQARDAGSLGSLDANQSASLVRFVDELEQHLVRACQVSQDSVASTSPDKVLCRARACCSLVGRAVQRLCEAEETRNSVGDGQVLRSELSDLAASSLNVGSRFDRYKYICADVSEAHVHQVWHIFGGVDGYITSLYKSKSFPLQDTPTGDPAWQRLTMESSCLISSVCQAGVDDAALRERLQLYRRYIQLRTIMLLTKQGEVALRWVSSLQASTTSQSEFLSCSEMLNACSVVRELVELTLQDASAAAAQRFGCNLQRRFDDLRSDAQSQKANEQVIADLAECIPALLQDTLTAFRDQLLVEEIQGMGFSKQQREIIDVRHQSLRHSAFASERALAAHRRLYSFLHHGCTEQSPRLLSTGDV